MSYNNYDMSHTNYDMRYVGHGFNPWQWCNWFGVILQIGAAKKNVIPVYKQIELYYITS